ncbi:hypothetical protein DIU31_011955 [Mucilaginibacter rubeus]|uniref:Zinc-ribbon domain-containing protein n=1 Tax=Mucilaginibacter rubeus TaxID=2027860 RepID=A0AAE6MI50_9SPHI|nr:MULTISPECIES: hypothetical protein [Mucilaginibacter]QEM04188.1 hypothetical protein DIU31_011955 [Mucilaginibacter rubeus]QEM16791.1 hypothetical protein DIU38_012075 [Mucilaginibacter gossypii]QTE46732.1 hypothetical protein J3L19_15665 [Mucilaginibacter rubeus]QTE53329.1 hypothetical protein J3L21_15640 [Mucilaginibacter rubeus]QTE58415.1 hypothetical protein J3L23_07310 [Mucilaginibacter rubeus]
MIIYGIKAKLLKAEITSDTCPNCNTGNSIQMNVFQRWAHIFWIPFFPIGKTGVSQCLRCRQVLKLKEMPASLKLSYDNIKSQTTIPVWTFAGCFLIVIGSIFFYISEKQKAKKVNQWVLSPQKNDVFHIKLKNDHYTLYRVNKVSGDSVYLALNKYESDREEGLDDIAAKGDTAYDNAQQGIAKPFLVEMAKEGSILDIERK